MHFPILQDILILLGFSVAVVFILQRFRLPSILGFLITGVIIGPYSLSWVEAIEEVEIISEFGVILLLFVIGMEISIKQLRSMRKAVFVGGMIQVGLSILVFTLIANSLGLPWNKAVFIGFLVSLSSTAIVLKMLQDRNELNAPHGRIVLGVLIFQDILVVPLMLITPILAGQATDLSGAILGLLLKSGLVLIFTYLSARYLVPRLLHGIAKTQSKELFLLTTIAICFAVAYLTSLAGLSLALGAFLAGLIVSESEYTHQATSTILPFRELFISFFFISIGMLLDISFFLEHVGKILLLVLLVFLLKGALASVAAAFLHYPRRTIFLTGLALFQIGEFAFILSKAGLSTGLLSTTANQYFLSVTIVTMLLTPFVLKYSNRLSSLFLRTKLPIDLLAYKAFYKQGPKEALNDHLVIIGYGVNGQNVARAARFAQIPYVILELNPATVRKERAKGEPIIFGDATDEHMLAAAHLTTARVVVVAISDPKGTKTIVGNIRKFSAAVYLIVRTRYVKEIEQLQALGADEVIPEEFETSIEIFSHVLSNYLVPLNEQESLVEAIRADNYKLFRPRQNHLMRSIAASRMTDLKIVSIRLLADSSELVGKSLAEADIRKRYGVNVLAVSRSDNRVSAIGPEEKLQCGDLVLVSGNAAQIDQFYKAVS